MATGKLFENGVGWRDFAASDLPASGVTAGSYGDATHVGAFTVAANGTITAASSVAITGGGGGGGGSEIGYNQATGTVTVTSTTEGSPTTLVAASAYTFDGAPVLLHFFCPRIGNPSSSGMVVGLYEGGSSIGRLGFTPPTVVEGLAFFYRFTPSAGSHTYTVSAFGQAAGNGAFIGGAGGASTEVPMFVRFTKV